MAYLLAIKSSILLFPFIAFLFTIPFMLHEYHKFGSINPLKTLIVYSFILYMITIYFLVILPLPKLDEVVSKPNMVRLIPFGFIKDILRESSFVITNPSTYLKALTEPCFYTVIFNVFMTIPFGMYLRYYFKCSFKKTCFYSFLLSLFFELTQLSGLYFLYPHPYRVFDVDDLLTNTIGGVIGYYLMGIVDNYLPTREEIEEKAIEVGRQVSGLRRITLFFLDAFLYIFFSMLASLFIRDYHPFLLVFLIYYGFIPILKKGKTLGGSFLNVKIEYKNAKVVRSLFRNFFLLMYYFLFPFWLLLGTYSLVTHLGADAKTSIYFYLASLVSILLFYFVNGIILIRKKKSFYDRLFKATYVSTIKKEEQKI
ncbi:MAG TPA: VanZ family protein [Firmicutes bacterium]|nr:VanZ family protein [Bacillota bacterium]